MRPPREIDVLPTQVTTVTEGGHTVRFVQITGPVPVHLQAEPRRPRNRLTRDEEQA